ncbi:hypothetical protein KC845_01510 [Candidatus Kaiserbacteria bacterium]|nr:hypothetical protein [Candidatus Kaiserbacteria bacterium]
MATTDVRSLGNGSFVPQNTLGSFDLSKESDTLTVLNSIHRSALDVEQKNELRDAVFTYRQNQDQANLVNACELFARVGITVIGCATPESESSKATSSNEPKPKNVASSSGRSGLGRPRPTFGVKVSNQKPAQPEPVLESKSEPTVAVEPKKLVVSEVVEEEVNTSVPEQPAQSVSSQNDVSPKVASSEVPTTAKFEPDTEVSSTPPATPTPSPIETVPETITPKPKVADRIAFIKKSVNEKVGNPVNLIDTHNELGREYMNALLEAMKKSNGGQAGEVEEAMARLEKAYQAVIDVIESGVLDSKKADSADNPSKNEISEEVKPKTDEAILDTKVNTTTPSPKAESVTTVATDSVTPSVSDQEPIINKSEPEPVSPVVDTIKPVPSVSELVVDKKEAEITSPSQSEVKIESTKDDNKKEKISPETPAAVVSVAKTKQVEELLHNQMIEEKKDAELKKRLAEAKMDPVMVSAVTSGLTQLLSEWSLFKSSGIFGTGPSGIDHPLYKKLSNLPMQAVVAGRFEGANPQIRQSLSDYMNGWRYEEGIVHDYGETFEHYLRRVIKHILDKRAKTTAEKTS